MRLIKLGAFLVAAAAVLLLLGIYLMVAWPLQPVVTNGEDQ